MGLNERQRQNSEDVVVKIQDNVISGGFDVCYIKKNFLSKIIAIKHPIHIAEGRGLFNDPDDYVKNAIKRANVVGPVFIWRYWEVSAEKGMPYNEIPLTSPNMLGAIDIVREMDDFTPTYKHHTIKLVKMHGDVLYFSPKIKHDERYIVCMEIKDLMNLIEYKVELEEL